MKLPHQAPLVFAKEIISLENDCAKVRCEFQTPPTLAVFIEASAQSSACFFQDSGFSMGYLANASNIELLQQPKELTYIIHLQKIISFENLTKYSFFITPLDDLTKVAKGELTVSLE